jgi:hypothetical protein
LTQELLLAAQAAFNLGYQVFGEAQVIQGLLQDLGGVLRLAAVALEAFSGRTAPALSGFGVFFRVSFRGRHGALLHFF